MGKLSKIVCSLELTVVEVQALDALIGRTAGPTWEHPGRAIEDIFMALRGFCREQRIPIRTIDWDNDACRTVIKINGWNKP